MIQLIAQLHCNVAGVIWFLFRFNSAHTTNVKTDHRVCFSNFLCCSSFVDTGHKKTGISWCGQKQTIFFPRHPNSWAFLKIFRPLKMYQGHSLTLIRVKATHAKIHFEIVRDWNIHSNWLQKLLTCVVTLYRYIREWPFDIYRGDRRLPTKQTFSPAF